MERAASGSTPMVTSTLPLCQRSLPSRLLPAPHRFSSRGALWRVPHQLSEPLVPAVSQEGRRSPASPNQTMVHDPALLAKRSQVGRRAECLPIAALPVTGVKQCGLKARLQCPLSTQLAQSPGQVPVSSVPVPPEGPTSITRAGMRC